MLSPQWLRGLWESSHKGSGKESEDFTFQLITRHLLLTDALPCSWPALCSPGETSPHILPHSALSSLSTPPRLYPVLLKFSTYWKIVLLFATSLEGDLLFQLSRDKGEASELPGPNPRQASCAVENIALLLVNWGESYPHGVIGRTKWVKVHEGPGIMAGTQERYGNTVYWYYHHWRLKMMSFV
jgi:hypothetical protein